MPQRTNRFQHLISTIESILATARPGATVTESKELVDKITGDRREVDIVIETSDGVRDLIVSIECTGDEHSRRATVEWVERMWGKHQSLPTNKLVLVSRAGFSSSAQKKAAWLGIDAYTLRQAEKLDWESKIHNMDTYKMHSFCVPYVTSAGLVLATGTDLADVGSDDTVLYGSDDLPISTVGEIIQQWITNEDFIKKVHKVAFENVDTLLKFEKRLEHGEYIIDRKGRKIKVDAIHVEAKCRKETISIDLEHNSYGNIAVAHGAGTSFGHTVEVIMVQKPNTHPIMHLSTKKQNKPLPVETVVASSSEDLEPRTIIFDFDAVSPDT